MATCHTQPWCPAYVLLVPVTTFHSRAVLSPLALAIQRLSCEKARCRIQSRWPANTRLAPVSTSHRRNVRSELADARSLPSFENST